MSRSIITSTITLCILLLLLSPQFARAEWWLCYSIDDSFKDGTYRPNSRPILKAWRDNNGHGLIEFRGERIQTRADRTGTNLDWSWEEEYTLNLVIIDIQGNGYTHSWIPGGPGSRPGELSSSFHCKRYP